jgi:hypothetical protein
MPGQQPAIPAPGQVRPGVIQVRLIGQPDVITAASAHLADLHGDAWTPSTRKPGRHEGGDVLLYGTLIVPVPG